ncbi:MAG: DUF4424 domain-containing protein [Aquabacterium sp.]|uniref:DUF4424 family protein n=1 Tax=Aquabacterium sp. TaxID=1872578 RepID=UPI00121F2BE7|nr:DUF4424 family protein [Aquabacterium sp.]TAK84228.1 MAG: DUF4424 domain-containing protein [Aquabacterium sp.]
MHIQLRALGFLAVMLIALPTAAWEHEEGLPAPSIQATSKNVITANSIRSEIHGPHVNITYELNNVSNHTVETTLSTYSEPYQWQGYSSDYPSLHFPEFTIRLNGSKLNKNVSTYAWLNGKDITSKLKSASIDPYLISLPEAAQPTSTLKKKRASAWLMSTAFQIREDMAIPKWLIQQNSSWSIKLPAQSASIVSIDYDARPATREVAVNSPDFASVIYRHCNEPTKIKQILASDPGRSMDAVRISEYVLPLQFGDVPLPAAQIRVQTIPSSNGLESLVTLSCGPEDASIEGAPNVPWTNAGHKNMLRILSITAQRK